MTAEIFPHLFCTAHVGICCSHSFNLARNDMLLIGKITGSLSGESCSISMQDPSELVRIQSEFIFSVLNGKQSPNLLNGIYCAYTQ